MSSKKAESPDYRGAAEAQGQSALANTQAKTVANRPNQYTPWGSSEWTQGSDGQWTQNINLDPSEQAALDAQQNVQMGRSQLASDQIGRAGEALQDPFNWEGAPAMGATPESAYNPEFAQTQMDRQMSLRQPQMDRQRDALETRLRNQGLRPDSEAYQNAMGDLQDQQGEEMSRMSQDAMAMGANEQGRQFGRDMQASGYQNQLRQQWIAEEAQKRGMSINEMNALISGQQVQNPNMPNFSQGTKADPTNYLGAAGAQGDFNLTNSANSPWNTALNAFGSSVGSSAAGVLF